MSFISRIHRGCFVLSAVAVLGGCEKNTPNAADAAAQAKPPSNARAKRTTTP